MVTLRILASMSYLALFVPFAVFFTRDGLPEPYATILGVLILCGSWAVGHFTRSLWAVLLPVIPWMTALVLIFVTPEEGEVGRAGAAILWSILFLFLVVLVIAGSVSGRRRLSGVREGVRSR